MAGDENQEAGAGVYRIIPNAEEEWLEAFALPCSPIANVLGDRLNHQNDCRTSRQSSAE